MKIFHLPDLGEGLAEAEIREWYVKEGDKVKVDQPLVSMETAKAVVDVPSPQDGVIEKRHGDVNTIVPTGAPLITFVADGSASKDGGSVVGALEESKDRWQEDNVVVDKKVVRPTVKAMPAARVLAKEMHVDLATVTGTGRDGLITPQDVKKALGTSSKTAEVGEKLHGVRRSMAEVMRISHQEVVPVTIFEDVNISHFTKDTDISVRLLQAIVAACQAEPSLNATFNGKDLSRSLSEHVHIGLAVDTPEGLFVPVIKNAEQKNANTLRETINTYKKEVKDRSIAADKLQGATITLSNFGTIAGRYATPIIVPPAVAILATGKVRDAPMVKDGQVHVGKILPLSLSFDHRAVTGGEATRFLGKVIETLQS